MSTRHDLGTVRVLKHGDFEYETAVYLELRGPLGSGPSIDQSKKHWTVVFEGYGGWHLQTLLFGYPARLPMRLGDEMFLDAGLGVVAVGLRTVLERALLVLA